MQSLWRARTRDRWIIVVPFKGAPHGKTRLSPALPPGAGFSPGERERLALAFLQDTVAAASRAAGVKRILVVSVAEELHDGRALTGIRCPVSIVADPGQGLNAAATAGIRTARAHDPEAWVAVMTGDLAGLRSRDLDEALRAAKTHPLGVVPDHSGVGTTVLTAAPGHRLSPRFGGDSRAAHEEAGHRVIELRTASTVRFDIDRIDDLEAVGSTSSGLGPASAECLLSIGARAGTSAGTSPGHPFSAAIHPRRMLDAIE
jgi:2-phospho-L-lactate guanylyltransferase